MFIFKYLLTSIRVIKFHLSEEDNRMSYVRITQRESWSSTTKSFVTVSGAVAAHNVSALTRT